MESVLMAVAFLAMLLVRPGWGGAKSTKSGDRGGEKGVRSGYVAGSLGKVMAWSPGLSWEPGLSPGEGGLNLGPRPEAWD